MRRGEAVAVLACRVQSPGALVPPTHPLSSLPLTSRLVAERETGKPRGFGFIEFFDIPTAESAIRNLSGKDFKGRTIR